jgi:hypothetical protein
MINENSYKPEVQEDPDKKMAEELALLIRDNKFTSDQIRDAYGKLCGISENDKQDSAVEKIYSKMNEMSEKGFPLNRFVELINAKQKTENAVPRYNKLIIDLDISSREKDMLLAIVEKKKMGEIECIIDGEVFASIKILKSNKPTDEMAEDLIEMIGKIMEKIPQGEKYGFMFTAK